MTSRQLNIPLNRLNFRYVMTQEEVGQIMGLSAKTIDHIERRALEKLRDKLALLDIDLYLTDGINSIATGYKLWEK